MFASVRAAFNIPRDQNLKLRDFPTLAHVIQFARERARGSPCRRRLPAKPVPPARRPPSPPASMRPTRFHAACRFRAASAARPLQADRRVARPRQPRGHHAGRRRRGRSAGSGCRPWAWKSCGSTRPRCGRSGRADPTGQAAPVHGVYWLPALDNEGDLSRWTWPPGAKPCRCASNRSIAPCAGCTSRLRRAGDLPGLGDAARRPARLRRGRGRRAAGRRGGRLHQDLQARADGEPWSKRSISKPDRIAADIADLLIEETLRDPGAVEIGYKAGERWTIGLEEQPAADGQPGMTLDSRHRLPGHRRGRQYRLRHHRRSGGGVRRHVLPARPGAGARSRTIPTWSASRATKKV